MTIETFIHTPDGKFKPDLPWWQTETEARIIDPQAVKQAIGNYEFKKGEKILIDEECLKSTKQLVRDNQRRGQTTRHTAVRFIENHMLDSHLLWYVEHKHLEPIGD